MSNRRKQTLVKRVSSLLILVMLFSVIIPLNTLALNKEQGQVENKMDSSLLKEFEKEKEVQYLVILHEQINTEKIANKALENAKKNKLSNVKAKTAQQKAVVSALRDNAKSNQKDLVAYLKKDTKNIKDYHRFYIVNGIAVTGTKKSAEKLASFPEVKSVILDEKQKLIPMEEGKKSAIATDDEIEWNIDRIGASDVWDKGITGEGTVVANIDSGVNGDHPALKEQYRGYNPDDPKNPSHEFNWHDAVAGRLSPMDSDGHGTHTMGTMVGQEEDGKNKIGVAPGAKWISARAFFMDEGYDSYILEAAEWVLAPTDKDGIPHPEMAPDVVNNSWGGNPLNNDWFLPMVQAWRNAGIVPVFSVGNSGLFNNADPGSASAPANYDEAIAVGATDEDDKLAYFSLRGPSENGNIKPDIVAPGVNIRSSWPGETWDTFKYEESNGTSMAAPHVAATVLLMKQVDQSLTVDQIDDTLKITAIDKTDDEYTKYPNNGYGYGMLDAKAAVEAVEQGIGVIDGQVVTEGQDNEAPTFEQDIREVVYKGNEANFSVRAMDNISVNKVTLTILKENDIKKTYAATRIDGDQLDGMYETIIPKVDITGNSLQYWWTIEDFSGEKTESEVYDVRVEDGVKAGYFEDFESYPDGWYAYGTNNSWEWGIPKYGPDSAASGDKVMGTHLRGEYEMNSDMTLVMPPVIVDDQTQLRFKNWYKLGFTGRDHGTVFASLDGENWEKLYQVSKDNAQWHEIGIDLSKYAGEKVFIAFNLQTVDEQNAGWYIDDVRLANNGAQALGNVEISNKKLSMTGLSNAKRSFPASDMKKRTAKTGALPVQATVEVKETGWKVKTNPQNGEFVINHPPGDYTLKIDAYGFESKTENVTLSKKGKVSSNVTLTPLQEQLISGKIEDDSGNKIKDATIFILEDEKVKPVTSQEDGSYQLNTYEGTYTVKVFAAGYYSKSEQVNVKLGEDIYLDIQLDPFKGKEPSEIKYDNGGYGKNLAMGKKGNGFAVKMSLNKDKPSAMLTGAKLQFWAAHVPVPGGDDILISVYDARGEDGAPGNKIVGPVEAKAKRDLYNWTEVDLSDLGIVVDEDFYIVYQQADDYPYVPGFVSDGDSKNWAARSWDYIGGQWFQSNKDVGNYMIRAVVDYGEGEVVKPVITSPEHDTFTNEENIMVQGTAATKASIKLMNNDKEVEAVEVGDDGKFTIQMELKEGKNELRIVSISDGEKQVESDPVTVTLDTIKPELSINSPKNGDIIDNKKVIVEGIVSDSYLDYVEVNGQKATVKDDKYQREVSLDSGENKIEVIAVDKANNSQTKTINVISDTDQPVIADVKPSSDQYLLPGDEINISFKSKIKDGVASFEVKLPAQNHALAATENKMKETEPGVYEGIWKAPANVDLKGAIVEVEITDKDGVKNSQEAEGKLFIYQEKLDRIAGDLRYDTAIEISKKGWGKSDIVVIARGDEFSDALAGVPYAYQLEAPILLTPNDKLYNDTLKEIKRLGAKNAVILGGDKAITETVSKALENAGLKVERVAGKDRFDTASLIASKVAPKGTSEIAVANGMNFPDALSVASHAAKAGMPILLTQAGKLPESTKTAIKELKAKETVVIGGPLVVEEVVAKQLPKAERLSGDDRYDTNIEVAKHFGVTSKHMYIATGKLYADALTGAVLAAKNDSAIVLVHNKVPKETGKYLTDQKVKQLTIFGGPVAVDRTVESSLEKLIK